MYPLVRCPHWPGNLRLDNDGFERDLVFVECDEHLVAKGRQRMKIELKRHVAFPPVLSGGSKFPACRGFGSNPLHGLTELELRTSIERHERLPVDFKLRHHD